jgi:DNA-binding CsgD family transcriptional regulator
VLAGDIDQARRLMETVVRSVEGATDAANTPTMAVTLGNLHLRDGNVGDAIQWLERAARFAEPMLDNIIVAHALPGLAAAHRRLGDLDAARDHADRAVALARSLEMFNVLAEAIDESATLIATDDPEQAETLSHEALAIRVQHSLRTFYPDSLDALARLAQRAGSHVEAARLYAASDTARAAIGYPRPPIDHAAHDAAVSGLRTVLGADEFDAAWSEGAALSLDDAVAYASRARGIRSRPSTGWASLTPAELEVVSLTVQGLTNPEIGARLFMSRNTVKTHLTHVFTKLGVANRTELATFASSRNRHQHELG